MFCCVVKDKLAEPLLRQSFTGPQKQL